MYTGFSDEQLDLPPTEYLVPVPSRIPTEYQEVEGVYEALAPSWFTKKRVRSRGLTGRCPGGIVTEYEEAKYQHSIAEHTYEYDTPVVPGFPSLHTYEDAAANYRKDVNASRLPRPPSTCSPSPHASQQAPGSVAAPRWLRAGTSAREVPG